MKQEKTLSSHAHAAKCIRQELRTSFPGIKFTVRSDSYSGGNSVWINWENGPTDEQVNNIVGKYQRGHFNGMEDIYEYSNSRDDIPQVQFVQTQRDFTDSIMLQAAKVAADHYGDINANRPESVDDLNDEFEAFNEYLSWRQLLYRILNKIDLSGSNAIKEDPNWTGGHVYSGFIAVRGVE